MDISVKKLSEILKIDPQVLLDKMIAAGLSQTSVEDSVSNEDKQKLLAFIRSSKDSGTEDKPKAIVPTPQAPKAAPKPRRKARFCVCGRLSKPRLRAVLYVIDL